MRRRKLSPELWFGVFAFFLVLVLPVSTCAGPSEEGVAPSLYKEYMMRNLLDLSSWKHSSQEGPSGTLSYAMKEGEKLATHVQMPDGTATGTVILMVARVSYNRTVPPEGVTGLPYLWDASPSMHGKYELIESLHVDETMKPREWGIIWALYKTTPESQFPNSQRIRGFTFQVGMAARRSSGTYYGRQISCADPAVILFPSTQEARSFLDIYRDADQRTRVVQTSSSPASPAEKAGSAPDSALAPVVSHEEEVEKKLEELLDDLQFATRRHLGRWLSLLPESHKISLEEYIVFLVGMDEKGLFKEWLTQIEEEETRELMTHLRTLPGDARIVLLREVFNDGVEEMRKAYYRGWPPPFPPGTKNGEGRSDVSADACRTLNDCPEFARIRGKSVAHPTYGPIMAGELLIFFKEGVGEPEFSEFMLWIGGEVIAHRPQTNFVHCRLLDLSNDELDLALEKAREIGFVKFVMPNRINEVGPNAAPAPD